MIFRRNVVGFAADIEIMYHQLLVPPADTDALRFLWYNSSGQLKTYRMKAHLFGEIWSPSCANFALQKVAEEFSDHFPEDVTSIIRRSFYVDDCLHTQQTR
jgi:hypothetical protein